MKKLRIYVDTSVLGECFDPEFSPWSNALVEDFRRGLFRPVLSEVTAAEVERAPEEVRSVLIELLALGAEMIPVSPEALALVVHYESHLRGLARPQYRLRVGEVRVFYDVEGRMVQVLAIVLNSDAARWLEEVGERS